MRRDQWQRLACAAGINQTYKRPPRARRQQMHSARALLANNAHARRARGDLWRQIDAPRNCQRVALKIHFRRAERTAFRRLRRDRCNSRTVLCATQIGSDALWRH